MPRVYLDYAATTPLDPEIEQAMRPYHFFLGNASSVHFSGRQARTALEDARERLAKAINADSREIIFTSGGTEANNQAIFGLINRNGEHLITSSIEHSAVLSPARFLQSRGLEVTFAKPDRFGLIDPEKIKNLITPQTVLVSLMHVNNELGTIQEIRKIAEICIEKKIPLHVDAVQSLGFVPLDVKDLGADLLSLSAHKFYGPKGVGALFVRRGLDWPTFLLGGAQENGRRASTHNLPGIAGMSLAAEKFAKLQPENAKRLTDLRDRFRQKLLAIDGVSLNGHPIQCSPKHVNVSVENVDGEALLMNLDLEGVDASSGSACSSGTLEPSHVLSAIGLTKDQAKASVRFSLGFETTWQELEFAIAAFRKSVERSHFL